MKRSAPQEPAEARHDQTRLKVLHVVDSLGRGGAERNLVDLLRQLSLEEFENRVVGLFSAADLAQELTEAGVGVRLLGAKGLGACRMLQRALLEEISEFRPHVVHTQLFSSDIHGRLASYLSDVRVVFSTLQNRPHHPQARVAEFGGPWRALAARWLDRLTAWLAEARLIAVSEAVRCSYVQDAGFPESKIHLIRNGVDVMALRSAAAKGGFRSELELRGSTPLLVNVARHARQKGLEHLLTALTDEALRHAHLALVGQGDQTAALKALVARLGLGARVSFLGSRADVPRILAAANVFVLPSLYEGLPVALLEALALGVPTVASDLPEVREVTGRDGAVLCRPADPSALAAGIGAILRGKGPGREARVRAAHRVETEFSSRTGAMRFAALLRESAGPALEGAATR